MSKLKRKLFLDVSEAKYNFSTFGLNCSVEFLECANEQLTNYFMLHTGIEPSKNVSLSSPSDWNGRNNYEPGAMSKLYIDLYVNHNWNHVAVLWTSKSGRIYKLDDVDIDCNDIEFSFERLDTELYIKQLYPSGQKLPFVIKDLPFELKVTRLNMDCSLKITVDQDNSPNREAIIEGIHQFIGRFNDESEKKDRDEGVIHNNQGKVESGLKIIYEMDLGSVGFGFFKKLLKHLAKVPGIMQVEIA